MKSSIKTNIKSNSKIKQLGQGMTEYIIIVALIAIAAIGVYSLFGETVRDQVAGLANELSGQDADANIQSAQDDAGRATAEGDKTVNLGSYNESANKAVQ